MTVAACQGRRGRACSSYTVWRRCLPETSSLWLQLLAAGLLLTGNYGLYILGLERTTAEATQLMIQLAPMFLLLSGR